MYDIRYAVLMVLIYICLCDLMAASLLLSCKKMHFVTQDCTIDMRVLENTNILSYMFVSILLLYLDLLDL